MELTTCASVLYVGSGSEMTYDTTENLDFSQLNVSVTHKTHTTFALQACHSAHILLSTIIHDDSYGYWIRLQDNSRGGNSSIWYFCS